MRRVEQLAGSVASCSSATRRLCEWCGEPIPERARRDALTCSQSCRQARHRFGAGAVPRRRATGPLRLAYADPPYPGLSRRYYAEHPDYAGEVDHAALLSRLQGFDGWALSTSARALPQVLAACVAQDLTVRVAAWFRGARPCRSAWPLSAWEPVIYTGGRRDPSRPTSLDASRSPAGTDPSGVLARHVAPAPPDTSRAAALDASDTLIHVSRPRLTDRHRVIGAKPAAFAYWLFDLLGALPGDELVDLFPGSGGIARAWDVYAARAL